MAQRSKLKSKILVTVSVLYGLYLLKTLLGINLSGQHSAHWLFKAPIAPIEAGKDQLCKGDVEIACINRKRFHRKVRRRILKIIS